METNSAPTPENLHQEVTVLRKRVKDLEEELANSRRALIKVFYSQQPLPLSEEELKQIAEEERGVPLEDFITDLENAAQGRQS